MIVSKLFTRRKGSAMGKINAVHKEVLRLFSVFLFVTAIFGSGVSVCADDCDSSSKVDPTGRYFTDGLFLFNLLTHESGEDYIEARKTHVELLSIYLNEVTGWHLEYAGGLLTDKAASILKEVESARDILKQDIPRDEKEPNVWAKDNMSKSAEGLGNLLEGAGPSIKTPFDINGFQVLGEKCGDMLREALKDVTKKLHVYIEDLTAEESKDNKLLIEDAANVCEANRKALVFLFIFRFVHFEDADLIAEPSGKGLDVKFIRQFTGDINRTIYWNEKLEKKLTEEKNVSLLKEYTQSELRRLKILKAISNRDMPKIQTLLIETFEKSLPINPSQTKS